jgi:hypothetical protein
MRWALFLGSLAIALMLGVWALQVPAPRGGDAAAVEFSAARAMSDVRAIAARPHPVGSEDHARVQAYLFERMARLGLTPALQPGALSPDAIRRLKRWGGDPAAAGNLAVNIVGVLPGRDPTAPAVLIMAHYDSAWGSPGAADDGAGVAAVLEAVRAIRARGQAERSLVVLITDAEELNLDGARIFFSEHPLRDRIGSILRRAAAAAGHSCSRPGAATPRRSISTAGPHVAPTAGPRPVPCRSSSMSPCPTAPTSPFPRTGA